MPAHQAFHVLTFSKSCYVDVLASTHSLHCHFKKIFIWICLPKNISCTAIMTACLSQHILHLPKILYNGHVFFNTLCYLNTFPTLYLFENHFIQACLPQHCVTSTFPALPCYVDMFASTHCYLNTFPALLFFKNLMWACLPTKPREGTFSFRYLSEKKLKQEN